MMSTILFTGGGAFEVWIWPYRSGKKITLEHTWDKNVTYTVRIKAKDEYGAKSEWETLKVIIPINKPYINTLFLRFLENHPHMFTILRYMLGL